jgi:hypothetical protein
MHLTSTFKAEQSQCSTNMFRRHRGEGGVSPSWHEHAHVYTSSQAWSQDSQGVGCRQPTQPVQLKPDIQQASERLYAMPVIQALLQCACWLCCVQQLPRGVHDSLLAPEPAFQWQQLRTKTMSCRRGCRSCTLARSCASWRPSPLLLVTSSAAVPLCKLHQHCTVHCLVGPTVAGSYSIRWQQQQQQQ